MERWFPLLNQRDKESSAPSGTGCNVLYGSSELKIIRAVPWWLFVALEAIFLPFKASSVPPPSLLTPSHFLLPSIPSIFSLPPPVSLCIRILTQVGPLFLPRMQEAPGTPPISRALADSYLQSPSYHPRDIQSHAGL